MTLGLVLVVLPVLVTANIDVYFSAEFHGNAPHWKLKVPKVSLSGQDVAIISDTERYYTFNLGNDNVLNAVQYYTGLRPYAAYLHRTPRWRTDRVPDWHEVTRILSPKSYKIFVSTTPTLYEEVFKNDKTIPASFNIGTPKSVQDTVSSSWSKEGELSITQKIKYGINILADGREISFNYTSAWGKNTKQSQNVAIGATSPTQITLGPGQSITSQLHVTKFNIQIQIEYEASLSGQIFADFVTPYRGKRDWLFDIDTCMRSSRLNNRKISREVIDIEIYIGSNYSYSIEKMATN